MVVPPALATTIPSQFNCIGVNSLPFGGAEILALALVFLVIIVSCAVTFIDVAVKQMWPSTFLDPVVQRRVAKIQQDFPALLLNNAANSEAAPLTVAIQDGFDPATKPNTNIVYDRVVSQAPYVATRAVDEDLIYILANNDAFGTVSSYCSSTVRGYAMLSTMLLTAGMSISFLWTHNAMVYPQTGLEGIARNVSLLGYVLIFCTGIVMCGSNQHTVWRNTNIALWANIPDGSPLRDLHTFGVVSFCLLPMLAHGFLALTQGSTMPNYAATMAGISAQITGALLFGAPMVLAKCGLMTPLMAAKTGIIGEIIAVFASMMTFVQVEFYATSVCAGLDTQFTYAMYAAMIGPLVLLVAQHYSSAPTEFISDPSVILMNGTTPVAISGPPPVEGFNLIDLGNLPIIKPAQ